jgi:predicted small lipoprotein YifL
MWLAALAALVLATGGCEQKKPAEVTPQQKAAVEEQKAAVTEQKAAVTEQKAAVEEQKAAVEEQKAAVAEQKVAVEEQKAAVPTAAAKPAAAPAPPKTVTYQASQGQVTFDHQAHASNLACDSCHSTDPPIKVELGKDKAHQMCKGCHQEKGAGPTQCNGCHKKG